MTPLRTVLRIETERWWSATGGDMTRDVEVLECGHRYEAKANPHFGGSDLGERKRRRCVNCTGHIHLGADCLVCWPSSSRKR